MQTNICSMNDNVLTEQVRRQVAPASSLCREFSSLEITFGSSSGSGHGLIYMNLKRISSRKKEERDFEKRHARSRRELGNQFDKRRRREFGWVLKAQRWWQNHGGEGRNTLKAILIGESGGLCTEIERYGVYFE